MKLFPPDPAIDLYKTGFGKDGDPFNRIETSKSLSELVERIEDPLVIALDGEWGCGKTWFLKRWVGAHRIENGGRATTVYFDAFAHDFLDDPLIALTGVIDEHLTKMKQAGRLEKTKRAVAKLAKPVTRIALGTATGGVTEIGGAFLSALAGATTEEIQSAVNEFWKREDGRRQAMEELRAGLKELTKPDSGEGSIPLVVVVDELDRCRPDYALALLEIIKHFFSVEHVHFVLGVNRKALEHSVRARYGSGIDAERYLRRFISVSMRLPTQVKHLSDAPIIIPYFEKMAERMEMDAQVIEMFRDHIKLVNRDHAVTMRDINQILSSIRLVSPALYDQWSPGAREMAVSMILMRCLDSNLSRKMSSNTITMSDVSAFYGISLEDLEHGRSMYGARSVFLMNAWRYALSGGAEDRIGNMSQLFGVASLYEDQFDGAQLIAELRNQIERFVLTPAR